MNYPWKTAKELEKAEEQALSIVAKIDPWTATFEECQAVTMEVMKLPIYSYSRLVVDAEKQSIQRWIMAMNVKEARPAIEKGSGHAVLFAVNECLRAGLIAPKWLAEAFGKRFKAVDNLEARSWDDDKAFGKPLDGAQIGRVAERREAASRVHNAVSTLRAAEMPTGDALWDAAAEELGMSAGYVKKVYSQVKAVFERIDSRMGIKRKETRGRPKKSKT